MSDVKLYVYEVSQGMARTLSQMFLGKQIDGIWHTSIVVYGNEYFFGSAGIQFCRPGSTVLKEPTEVIDLGRTEIPKDVLDELLADLSRDRFHGSQYSLLRHNCNNFSDELAQFLTGRSIPERITGLPDEFLSTPLGAQLGQMINSMQTQLTHTQGYHFNDSVGGAGPGSGVGAGGTSAQQQPLPSPIKFTEPPADYAVATVSAASAPDNDPDCRWLDAVIDADNNTDDSIARLVMLLRQTAVDKSSTSGRRLLAAPVAADRFVSTLELLLASVDRRPGLAEFAGRIACNAIADLLDGDGGISAERIAACARRLLLSGGRHGLTESGGALSLNLLLLRPGNESLAFALGCLLTDRLQSLAASGAPEAVQLTLARALCAAARHASQLTPLAAVQGLSLAHLVSLCPHVAQLHQEITRANGMQ